MEDQPAPQIDSGGTATVNGSSVDIPAYEPPSSPTVKTEGPEAAVDAVASEPLIPTCEPPVLYDDVTGILQRVQRERQRPLFVLIALFIDDDVCDEVYRWRKELRAAVGRDDNLDVLIHSPGGDLAACYKVARLFARYTNAWEALVPRMAASGATLISLGSERIVLSDIAQLGPLDPQVLSKRRGKFFIVERQSPLEAFQAVRYLREIALTTLDVGMTFMQNHLVAPGPSLEAARELSVQLARPMLEKIEPYDLGAFALDSGLAKDYCRRVCQPAEPHKRTQRMADFRSLVEKYPSHDFVIDRAEAEALGLNVCEPSEALDDLFDELRDYLSEFEEAGHRTHAHSQPRYVGLVPKEEVKGREKASPQPC